MINTRRDTMPSKPDEQPFLQYTDDEAQCGQPRRASSFEAAESKSKRRWRRAVKPLVSHSLVFVLTSLLWIFLVLPQSPRESCAKPPPPSPPSSSPPSHAAAGHSHAGGHAVDLKAPPPHGKSSSSSAATHNATSGATFVSCGSSTAEAKAKGCRYDMLLNHWVAPACSSREWVDEYADDDTWYGYRDEARTQRIEGGPDALGEVDHYYTSQRDHVNHCVQMWRRQYVALFEGRNIDEYTASWGHTEHCSQFLLDVTDRFKEYYDIPILVEVGWIGCWVKEKPAPRLA
ncbi:hypothetical protein MAPG_05941 [Magnaporthiopsis poae ATCC 64411]|uniref:Uncharacterized protein n=1 Tax=Magnaporthiopsis poae (strain ATCC 64411 / 73-15) TaxID=644358 RepID=A0A0C4E0Q9_MAGP6|nr:hypothetical protein MAPG_05941 [Magnaporthiopsis poae ATCC 64411]